MDKTKKIPVKVALAAINQAADRLEVYGDIGSDFWSEGVTVEKVSAELKKSQSSEIDVHINSYGGDAFEGIAIFNALKQSGKKIVTYVDGMAASAASMIAMAGEEIKMPKNAHMVIHNAWTMCYGNQNDLRKVADDLEKLSSSYRDTYMDHFVGSVEELQTMMDEETDMTGEEAVELGLADEIVDYNTNSDDTSDDDEASIKDRMLAKYHKANAAISELEPESDPQPESVTPISKKILNLIKEKQ